ncbi:MAG TPA: cysteine desulfurase [Candidatus Omnitrophota bacterium]|nr:cysteine desulfurase [Candidatus Omnitrophota bacterium]
MNASINQQSTWNVQKIRQDFPLLQEQVYGKPLVYLDNAATTQKPAVVIETIGQFYAKENANIHRGIFCLSEQATKRYKSARHKIQEFIHASSDKEIIFVRGATEAINLVAQCYGKSFLKRGDEVLITHMEHHSNIVPWQMLAETNGIKLTVVPINDHGELMMEEFQKLLTDKVKLVSVVHVSNALGTMNPVKEIINAAHGKGIPVLVDGAQAVAHTRVDVQELDCDFYAFSGHKLLGPTGIGVLYGKKNLLEKMPPYQGGGDMIRSVTFEKTTYNDLPYKFEAGTPHIAGVIGLGTAVEYIQSIGLDRIEAYEQELLKYGTEKLLQVPGLRMIGTAAKKSAILSFVLGEAHAHDIGTILDRQGIAIRAGHHCAMPVMQRFKVPATTRASLAFYNTFQEIDRLAEALREVIEVFK